MKNFTLLITFLLTTFCFAQQQTVTYSVSPTSFEETDNITLTFNGSSINEATWGVSGNALYLWAWSFDVNNQNIMDCPTNGTWTASNEANRLTYNSGTDTYTISFVPATFYQRTGIGRIGFLVKAKNGTGDKKSQDILLNVGAFQVTLTTPQQNSSTVLSSGGNLNIVANNSGGNASYVLKANGTTINTNPSTSNYAYNHTNITSNQNYQLEVTLGGTTITKSFSAIVNPGTVTAPLPAGMVDGINYNATDNTKATLVLNAPNKDFVYVAGSFNNWQPNATYAMKKDGSTGKFWLELTGLVPGQNYSYQYWVVKQTPIANSPKLVKTADPFSTLVLSPFDDPGISTISYPNLPAYPAGQEREVTVLKTGEAPYNWQVTNFTKPKKEDLVVYEVLIRDFDANRNYQSLINRIDYFKNLKVNAIELMPIMEYEGNESWGYNTAFHMALDKYYGTENKLKEFIDLCHQNGIAVILDVALNHAFGRNPMVRMWMNDPDGDGWGGPSSESPYFNQTATHSYSVGEDFNHQKPLTQYYVQRVIKHWIQDFKIDGFRWDLTKGFTQNCTGSDGCTNSYQQDRVDILKAYADYSWSLDANHYVIFEHLGTELEEKEWANYRFNEGKGVMLWGKMTDPYNQLTMGYNSNNNIAGIGHKSRPSFLGARVMGYAESHDEERLMYKNVTYGNNSNSSYNVRNLNIALGRMSALGAVTIPVPGPKMIWHFGDLGMNNSVYTCYNGTVNDESGTDGNCKLDTKPQPQWTNNWLADANRSKIYSDWSRLIQLKKEEAVFEGDYDINSGGTLTPKIYVFNNSLPSSQLKNVVVLANFDVTSQNVTPNFPYTGVWYDLMDSTGATSINVTNTGSSIPIAAGQFKMYGNKASILGVEEASLSTQFKIYPNPVNSSFNINKAVQELNIYDITGKLVKTFKGNFTENDSFDISNLTQSLYLVKIENSNGQILTSKLIKL
ncbi:MAG: alpha-amylase family glycosyl hydrolase [Gelidibacter sp.]